MRTRQGWQLCLVCDGAGWKRRETEPAWDGYLEMPLEEAAQLPRPSSVTRHETVGEDGFTWERLRRRYDRHGSYQELRRNLDRLSLTHRRRYRLVRAVLVDHEPRTLDETARFDLELGVLTIALGMRTVRVPGWLIERTEAVRRSDTIATLLETGMSAGEIARRLGVSRRAIIRKMRRDGVESGKRRVSPSGLI